MCFAPQEREKKGKISRNFSHRLYKFQSENYGYSYDYWETWKTLKLFPFTIVIFEEKAIFRKDAQLPRQEWQIEIMAWNRNKNCNRRARQANSTNFSYTKKERKKERKHSRYNWHDKRSTRSSPCRIFPDTGRTRRVVNDKIVYLHIDSSTKVNYGVS